VQLAVVVDVMKHGRVWTSTDNRRVRRTGRAMPPEYLLDQRLKLILFHPSLSCLHRLAMSFSSDVSRSLHDLDLFGRLEHAHLVYDRRRVDDRLRRVHRLAIPRAHV